MYVYNTAYRHLNGEVEGFTACGESRAMAGHIANKRIRAKCEAIRDAYDPTRVISSLDGLTPEEVKLIASDWRQSF